MLISIWTCSVEKEPYPNQIFVHAHCSFSVIWYQLSDFRRFDIRYLIPVQAHAILFSYTTDSLKFTSYSSEMGQFKPNWWIVAFPSFHQWISTIENEWTTIVYIGCQTYWLFYWYQWWLSKPFTIPLKTIYLLAMVHWQQG